MLARLLKVLTAAGIALGIAVAYGPQGLRGPELVLAVAAGYVGFFALLTLGSYALAAIGDSGKRKGAHLNVFHMVKLFFFEWYAFFILYAFTQTWPEFFVRKGLPRKYSRGGRLIVLVHGYFCNRGAWFYLKSRLEKLGHNVATIDLEPPFSGIDKLVEGFQKSLNAIVGKAAPEEILIVGHSMGGLVASTYMHRHGKGAIVKLVTLGTPYKGTFLAHAGAGRNVSDMMPGSEWLRRYSSMGLPPVPTVCVWTRDDNIVSPRANSVLAGTKAVRIDGIGHMSLLFSRRVLAALKEEIAAAGEARLPASHAVAGRRL